MVVCDGIASESVVARYFDPELGRFLTQDSYLGSHDSPPSLHRYLYGYANPLRYVDPTGHTPVSGNESLDEGSALLARATTSDSHMSPELAQALQSYAESSAPAPTVVVEEDNGPLGNLIMRPLRALGRTGPVQKAGEGLRWLSDGLNALATKMGVIARGVTKEQAARQDDQALREKVARYRAFDGRSSAPSDEIAARHIAVNTGREFVEDVADVNQRVTEEATREGVPMLAGVIAKKGLAAADDVAEGLSGGRAATTSRTYVSYEFKNAKGQVVYVGRASGVGTPEQVLRGRLARGHHVYDATPGLTAEVKAVQGGSAANKGAEGILYERRLKEGAPLLNDPKSPPLSSKPSKAAEVRRKIDEYHEDLKKP